MSESGNLGLDCAIVSLTTALIVSHPSGIDLQTLLDEAASDIINQVYPNQ